MNERSVLQEILGVDLKDCTVSVCLASILADQDLPQLASLQMKQELAERFKDIVATYLAGLRESLASGDLLLKPYDPGYKADTCDLEWLKSAEVDEVAASLGCVPDPIVNTPLFDRDDDFIAGLHFYVIVVERRGMERLLFFRKYDPKKELSRSKWLAVMFSDNTFDTVHQPIFLFDERIDCFARDGYMYISHKHEFQQIFRFFEKVREKAQECLQTISERIPIANFEVFADSCRSHLHKLTKLLNIAAKPYLQTVTMKDLKRTIKKFNLPVQTTKENGREELVFDPAQRWAILKLLDDDYLGSVMTKLQYEVNSKRVVEA